MAGRGSRVIVVVASPHTVRDLGDHLDVHSIAHEDHVSRRPSAVAGH